MNEQPEEPNKAVEAESILPIDEHVEETQGPDGRKVRHRGIYLLPNLFTTANLFAGILFHHHGHQRSIFTWLRRTVFVRWCSTAWMGA